MRLSLTSRFAALLVLALCLPLLLTACQGEVTEIGILEAYQGADVDATRTAFLETLRAAGYKAGEQVRFFRFNAETQERTLEYLAGRLANDEKVDIVLTLSGAARDATVGLAGGRPIVYALTPRPFVTIRPQENLAGVLAEPPMEQTLALVRALLPRASRVGLLYAEGDADSVVARDLASRAAQAAGVTLVAAGVTAPEQAARAAQGLLAQNIQAIVLAPAHVLEQRFDDLLRVSNAANVPVFAWSEGLTVRGALASWGLDYADHGRRAGRIMEQVLRGVKPGSIPLDTGTARLLWLNAGVAQRLGVTIPPEVQAQAARIIGP